MAYIDKDGALVILEGDKYILKDGCLIFLESAGEEDGADSKTDEVL